MVHDSETVLGRRNVRAGTEQCLISAVGDASAYRHVDSPENTAYGLIHERVRGRIKALDDALDVDDAPLIVMAHSLGGHIMSNYIWDMQNPGGNTPMTRVGRPSIMMVRPTTSGSASK